MNLLKQIKENIGQKLNGISYNIDVVGNCSLFCPSCAVGSIKTKRHPGKYMSVDTWVKILEKGEREARVRKVQMYAYTDPCLHPDLDQFVAEATKRNIPTLISTMGQQTRCDFEKVVEARPHELRISFPGWNRMEYYQKNAKPEVFDRNVELICSLPRHKETLWSLVFHVYKDNQDELPRARELAAKWNLKFVAIPAIFMVLEKTVEKNYTEQDKELISHLIQSPEEALVGMKKTVGWCDMYKQITLDCMADVYLCQLVFQERFKLMNFFDAPISEIQRTIRNHSFCGKCMQAGGNILQACYKDFTATNDPVGEANKKRHYKLPVAV